ncbi:Imm43 family immunity protein [Myxococcus qinghaiensis]|uniref:Imm43 family immunity protein n=1 Tax=Myxococcus qinghaiensis TaxID=2906758 RepID=UPI0020A749BA|nr:DUF1629 domain-containing protein [Myxococcus qinghaiensis]MCP3162793.1 hypothetical protein [Myxococcus qinghaiensis]
MDYFALKVRSDDGGRIDEYPCTGPILWKFAEGRSLAKDFPMGATVSFSDSHPERRSLYDFQPNLMRALLVSGRARKLIESLEVTNAEWLPVAIKDHKGKVIGPDYAFLNLLGAEDAIDLERSVYKMSSLEKDQLSHIRKLVLKPDSISPHAKMFRCTMQRHFILIREDVHAAFVEAGLTGLKLYSLEEWRGQEL